MYDLIVSVSIGLTNSLAKAGVALAKNFFDHYPEQIFSPLTGDNRRLFLDILISLYHGFFDDDADFDGLSPSATQVRQRVTDILSTSRTWFDEQTGKPQAIDPTIDLVQKTHYCFQRLVESGWLKVERQGHKDHVFMSPLIIELLEFLDGAGKDISKNVGGSVLTVRDSLDRVLNAKSTDQDIFMSLGQAVDESRKMSRRMNRLASHLRDITEKIAELPDAAQKAEAFFNGFINESSFADYNDIKDKNHPMRFKSDILQMLHKIEFDQLVNQRVVSALEVEHDDRAAAKSALIDAITKIRGIFIRTDSLLDRVDKAHANLVHRFNEALRYRRRAGTDMKVHLEEALTLMRENDLQGSVNLPSQTPEVGGVSEDHLYKIKRQKRQLANVEGSKVRHVSKSVLLKNEMHREYLKRMTVTQDKLNIWLSEIMLSQDEIKSTDIKVETPDGFMLFIQSLRLCSGSAFFNKKFVKTLKQFEFKHSGSQDVAEHDVVYCREFTVKRRYNTTRAEHV